MASLQPSPIEIDVKPANGNAPIAIKLFNSYSFDRSILTPASAFRFTAPGVDKDTRTAIRSGDLVTLFAVDQNGNKTQIATGIIDQTDTHVTPTSVTYILTGRDMVGQLVDNDSVDTNNQILNTTNMNLLGLTQLLIKNTRIPPSVLIQQAPNGQFLVKTNPGDAKISILTRYLDLANCLVWSVANGQLKVGKPDFTSGILGTLSVSFTNRDSSNVMEARSQRDVNRAIRQIVTQLQTQAQVDPTANTKVNGDPDMRALEGSGVGRSVYRVFSYAQGEDASNQLIGVGNYSANPRKLGDEYSLREIARANMSILDVEIVVQGHVNSNGIPYDIDQMYHVKIEDDNVDEDMYIYQVTYQLTADTGLTTHLKLCRTGTICAFANSVIG